MASESRALRVLNLFEQYYERVYCFARRSVDPSTAEDIAQEVFVRLLHVADLESRVIQVGYLLKIADNLIKRGHRRNKLMERHATTKKREIEQEYESPRPGAPAHNVGAAQLRREFGTLTEREQEAVRLIVLRGLSYEEAARALGVKASSVNNWKFRGVQRLKQHTSRQEIAGRQADGSSIREERDRDQSGRARFGQRAG
jgi:RNA polymerase sigma-70 factor (ECF subfamily)